MRKKHGGGILDRMNEGTVVLLTGAASGIGLHLVTALARRGARVLATDIDEAALFAASERAHWSPRQVVRRRLDVTREEDWSEAMDAVQARWGRLDVALLVAGYLRPGLVHELAASEIHRHVDINTKGVMLGATAAARVMKPAGRGHIIAIGSLASVAPVPGLSLYSASKFAVRGFCLSIAEELRPHGVAVSVLLPDAVETPMLALQRDFDEAALTFSGIRPLSVEDIEAALFDRVLPDKPLEVLLPAYRGALAKLASLSPESARLLTPLLRAVGRRHQQKGPRNA
jgi:3-oxoacyl-[acyl-carrier protein] reductase